MFTYFLMLGGSNYFRACNQGFTLIDYANLYSFTIDSSCQSCVGMQIEELKELYSADSHYENNDKVAYSLIRVDLILEMLHITSS
jgi:hypothetical protein